MRFLFVSSFLICFSSLFATDYHVGPQQGLASISEVPWSTLEAGDVVYIHWQATPYKEKWVINRQGTALQPIRIIGIDGPEGQQPVIDGNGAQTASGVNFWNDSRGIIKIGGSSIPEDGLPMHIIIENLEIRSARPAYQFSDESGQTSNYANNAAAIYVEKAAHLTIRNCTLHDCGNGLFIGAFDGATEDILIEKNYFHSNGIEGRYYEHNTYTAAIDITYQFNRFGPLRDGAQGNNLKDRSAGLVVKYNWIEGGNRQLDLVDAEDSEVLVNHPSYTSTYVYGNTLIEPDGAGNSQIAHYGGDSGTETDYRKGDLYFYNNTVISTRSGTTTLVRLSTNEETANIFNNVIYTTASAGNLALIDGNGTVNLEHNWLSEDWKECHCTPDGRIFDHGNNLTGSDPEFQDFANQNFTPTQNSPLLNAGVNNWLAEHTPDREYTKHQGEANREMNETVDIGAFEHGAGLSDGKSKLPMGIQVFPTLVQNELFIIQTQKHYNFQLFDPSGKFMRDLQAGINFLEDLSSGFYYLKATSSSGRAYTFKITRL